MDETRLETYENEMEAQLWADLLRQSGVPCRVEQSGAEIAAVGLDAWVPHSLWVLKEDLARAREILAPEPDALTGGQ
jgi:hypothetical protein